MSDRSVSVNLKANVAGFVAGIEQAKLKTADFAKATAKNAQDHKQSWDKVGKGMMLTGGVIAAGVGLAVKTFADFDKQMSAVKAVSYDSSKSLDANAKSMDKLRAAALKAGADTKYSAGEAAKAEEELAKVGISTADILGGALAGSLNLAAAGNLDLAEAAAISGKAMKIFKLEGKDVGHIADVLASGANKSAADVTDLGQALAQGGLIAAQTGLTLEDTVGTLSMFADNALMGSDAGTSLKTMLMRLNPQSDAAAGLMDELGLRAYDANGEFVGMAEYAGRLQRGLGGLSDEQRNATMTTLYGSDAVRAANILYKEGAAGVVEYTEAVNDEGAAARVAAIQMDNLAGDIDALKGSIETGLIQAGAGANDILRDMTQKATEAVNWFGKLSPVAQKSAFGIAAVGSAGLLTVGAFITVIPKIQATKAALKDMGVSSERTGTALKGLGKAAGIAATLAAVAAATVAITNATQEAIPGLEATTSALLKGGDAAEGANKLFQDLYDGKTGVQDLASAFERLTNKSWKDGFNDKIGAMFGEINDATKSADVFDNIGQSLAKMVTSGNAEEAGAQFDAMAAKLGLTKDQLPELLNLMPAYSEAVAGVANETALAGTAAGEAEAPTKALAQSEKDLAAAADAAKKTHDALIDSVTNFGSVMMAARGDARSYEAAIDAATASLKENGKTLDIGTEKGRNNQAALDAIAGAALKLAESNLTAAEANGTLGRATKTVSADVGKARDAFIKQAIAMGMPKKAAEELATKAGLSRDRVKEITNELIALGKQKPKPVVTILGVAAGLNAVDNLKARLASLKDRGITVTVTRKEVKATIGTDVATGGYVTGPGTGTSDSIPANLSNGEFVIRAASVKKVGLPALHKINSYADGGLVTHTPRYVSAPSRSTMSAAGAAAGGGGDVNVTAQFALEGRVMQQVLLKLKRSSGGGLGLEG